MLVANLDEVNFRLGPSPGFMGSHGLNESPFGFTAASWRNVLLKPVKPAKSSFSAGVPNICEWKGMHSYAGENLEHIAHLEHRPLPHPASTQTAHKIATRPTSKVIAMTYPGAFTGTSVRHCADMRLWTSQNAGVTFGFL